MNETLAGNPFPPPGVASGMMMGGLPWSTSTPNGAPVTNANIHFHFQCWPQCLGLRRPYLCIGKRLIPPSGLLPGRKFRLSSVKSAEKPKSDRLTKLLSATMVCKRILRQTNILDVELNTSFE